ncbi:phosphoglycerate mutase (2,3-diphosphoglycerate-independent) [Candidatus Roizmanbacteria bacterium RIFCSPLOWO2_01_FULL_38_11]|uniref:2,3-bisphosphoglycerate-independent phosphoglycerate mutase n=1 Tax=Candidatus Roizmanbacteria bacterium RIFCSPLOWO2_01_FULL_38_11 TaxID=1802060 RepID=A0A1F7IKD1_9BACT|nr:MAG: phosphoglycerate mutase (2,3-diphosphoglycerate-independent) [Candidatus Roizmanbacteria bacterium RIFCSPLOWO2_01_FULL_38_11]
MKGAILIVLDGLGVALPGPGNAYFIADPPHLKSYFLTYPHTQLKASGEAVGLPADEVGSTEVGHVNLGAGRIVYQSLPRINLSIADGSFFKNEAFIGATEHVKRTKGVLHFIGLLGGGTVHASTAHLHALLFLCKENKIDRVCIHVITDGRDSPPQAASTYLEDLQSKLDQLGIGKIATVMGRYYAMDRDRRWDRVEKAYSCMTKGGQNVAQTWQETIDNAYKQGITDEFIEPTNILGDAQKPVLIQQNDSVIFYNFRIDRPRELTKAFVLDNFESDGNKLAFDPYAVKYSSKHNIDVPQESLMPPFHRGDKIPNIYFVTMTEYEKDLPVKVAFPPHIVKLPLGRVISEGGYPQLRMAESEKERFVTYYFNGLRESPFPLEDHLIVPSPKVPTYDLKPEMSALEISDSLMHKIRTGVYKFILVNFANPDMVGHTGNLQAAVKAVSCIDECLDKIVREALLQDYIIFITADHGNVEEMLDPKTGGISTEHSANLVPFLAISNEWKGKNITLQSGILADVAPTLLSALGIQKPVEMTGRNLLNELQS